MVTTERTQPDVATTKTPQKTDQAGFVEGPTVTLSPMLSKLSELREKYLTELQTAREKVKQNFLK